MSDTRKKATMPQVLADIKPYLTKRFLSEPVIDDKNLPVICQTLLCRYSNVKLVQGVTNNKPNLRLRVEGVLSTKERSLKWCTPEARRRTTCVGSTGWKKWMRRCKRTRCEE